MDRTFCVSIIGRSADVVVMGPSDSSGEITFEELCDIATPIAREHGMIKLYLFGSRARGEGHDGSDYDFCLVAPKEYGLMEIGSFLYDMQEALDSKVDIVCEEDLHNRPSLMEEVMRDRRIVFEA